MAFIRTIPPADAPPELEDLYRRAGNPDGTVDNVMSIHSLNPESLRTHFEMYTAAMHRPSPLTRAEREMAAVVVSRLNGCTYCLRHHSEGLRRLMPAERQFVVDDLASGRVTQLEDREAAITSYAMKLTMNPRDVRARDIDNLRAAGLDDRAVLDLAQVVGYVNYVNRIVTGLGVELGGAEGDPGQWPEKTPDHE